jgi:predicted negative regulator of RcsB-dependent stress response
VADHYEEEAQAEQLKRWWNENWKSLAAGLVLGLAVIVGWEGYKRYQLQQADQASQLYDDLKAALAAHKNDAAVALGDKLVKEFQRTPYAVSAAFYLAQISVDQNKLDDAVTRLQWVTTQSKDEGLRDLAKLRLAKVLWQQKKTDDALKLLDGEHGGYNALFAELRGDIKLSQNDRAAARTAYEQALTQSEGPNRELIQRKLDDLADAVKS